jgi:hypothetical protein
MKHFLEKTILRRKPILGFYHARKPILGVELYSGVQYNDFSVSNEQFSMNADAT